MDTYIPSETMLPLVSMRLLQDERVRRAAAMLPLRSEQVLSRDLSTETTVFTGLILTLINRVYIVSVFQLLSRSAGRRWLSYP